MQYHFTYELFSRIFRGMFLLVTWLVTGMKFLDSLETEKPKPVDELLGVLFLIGVGALMLFILFSFRMFANLFDIRDVSSTLIVLVVYLFSGILFLFFYKKRMKVTCP